MGLEVRGIDHQSVGLMALIGQFQQHPCEDALLAPPLPAVVEGLGWTIFGWRIPPP